MIISDKNAYRLFECTGLSEDIINKINSIEDIVIHLNKPITNGSTLGCFVHLLGISESKADLVVTLPYKEYDSAVTSLYDGEGYVYTDEYVTISIKCTNNSPFYGGLDIGAGIRLSTIRPAGVRTISIFDGSPGDSFEINDGYNIKATYSDGTLTISGGPGLGRGTYNGPVDIHTKHKYNGIRSINGRVVDNNVNISMSDLLTEYGAEIYA